MLGRRWRDMGWVGQRAEGCITHSPESSVSLVWASAPPWPWRTVGQLRQSTVGLCHSWGIPSLGNTPYKESCEEICSAFVPQRNASSALWHRSTSVLCPRETLALFLKPICSADTLRKIVQSKSCQYLFMRGRETSTGAHGLPTPSPQPSFTKGNGISAHTLGMWIIVDESLSPVWLRDPMDCSSPGFPVLHCVLEFV